MPDIGGGAYFFNCTYVSFPCFLDPPSEELMEERKQRKQGQEESGTNTFAK